MSAAIPMFSTPTQNVLERLHRVQKTASGWQAYCPHHEPANERHEPSLSVAEGRKGCVVTCHRGCTQEEVVAAIGLTMADLFNEKQTPRSVLGKEYTYISGDGKVIGWKVRNPEGANHKYDWFHPLPDGSRAYGNDAEKPLYRLPDLLARTDDRVFIAEGEKDVDSLTKLGLLATCNPNGAGKPREVERLARDLAGRKVIILHDNDEPGRKHADNWHAELLKVTTSVRIVTLPDLPEKGDVSDFLAAGKSLSDLLAIVDAPQPNGIVTVMSLHPNVKRLYEEGRDIGVSTGFASLDPYWRIRPADLNVITGIPGHGKSTALDQLVCNLIRREWRFGMASFENLPHEEHITTLLEKLTRQPFDDGLTERMSAHTRDEAMRLLDDRVFFIDPPEDDLTLGRVLMIAEQMVVDYKITGLVIDPWNELSHSVRGSQTEVEYISECLTRVRRFARRAGVAVFIVVHPTKMLRKEDGTYGVPTLYDCAGAAHWRNKADNGISVWRDLGRPDSGEVEIHVQKIRHRRVGKLGMAKLMFDKVTGGYRDPE